MNKEEEGKRGKERGEEEGREDGSKRGKIKRRRMEGGERKGER